MLLKIVKTYQLGNPWYILLKEVPHGFTPSYNLHQGINHSSSLLLRVRNFFQFFRVRFLCLSVLLLVDIKIYMEIKWIKFVVKPSIYVQEKYSLQKIFISVKYKWLCHNKYFQYLNFIYISVYILYLGEYWSYMICFVYMYVNTNWPGLFV